MVAYERVPNAADIRTQIIELNNVLKILENEILDTEKDLEGKNDK